MSLILAPKSSKELITCSKELCATDPRFLCSSSCSPRPRGRCAERRLSLTACCCSSALPRRPVSVALALVAPPSCPARQPSQRPCSGSPSREPPRAQRDALAPHAARMTQPAQAALIFSPSAPGPYHAATAAAAKSVRESLACVNVADSPSLPRLVLEIGILRARGWLALDPPTHELPYLERSK